MLTIVKLLKGRVMLVLWLVAFLGGVAGNAGTVDMP